ncbi:expansin EXLX1 family cellulose-binding protein [Herbivorax sp. ANBcel31]|uniref:expansin EXLX1 family cellulose-binding protein n=1 Tax=Herbivorax sp. ANBcel31 TaxID=3069754 RepID=UPI0027B7536D|nr:expansin EXLX1 family cellulose-binding protein [Herbivorax sp. ANBcel31]MDQ2086970.1 expansin EXLX1 family cellulose-binding protein [Herbivorax sp. ANBcel31]
MKKGFCLLLIVFLIQTFSFAVNGDEQGLIGDINGDGEVDSTDATILKRYLLEITDSLPAENKLWVADTNGDGIIDSSDYVVLVRYILNVIDQFPKEVISQTPSPEPINTGAYPDWDKVHSSYATFTGSGYTGGASLLDPIPSDMEITALNPYDYNSFDVDASLAGAYLEVTGEKGSTVVYVNDLYPEGGPGALDLNPTSFAKIGDMEDGIIDIEWKIVAAPITENVLYRIKEGSSPCWLAVQVRNHKYPVLKMEIYQDNQWHNMQKMPYNHFLYENIDSTTPKIRITDIRGYVITDVIDSIPEFDNATEEAYIVPGNVQFPD